jgi:hypothetical protein
VPITSGDHPMSEDKGYDALMHDACVGWGFCGSLKRDKPIHVGDIIPDYNPNAEPERWRFHKAAIRAAFVRHMGGETVDAARLRFDPDEPPDPGPHEKFRGWLGG